MLRGRPQDILFYQLPEHAEFYSELLNLLEEGGTGETPTGAGQGRCGAVWGGAVCDGARQGVGEVNSSRLGKAACNSGKLREWVSTGWSTAGCQGRG